TDERNGYNQQPERWGGDYGGDKTLTINGRNYTYALGSYDCSSSTITAWQLALQGTPYEGALDGATYTGDMRSVFVNSGLFYAEYSPAKRGDLYLAEGSHVAMCQDGGSDGVFGYDCLTEFNRNENHAASWGEPGDQDGYESILRDYYDDGWNTVLHYNGKADYDVQQPKPVPKPHQEPGDAKNDAGLKYQGHSQDLGWLPEVRDGQTAGTVGYGKRLEAIKFTAIPEGWELTVRAHIANVGWKNYGVISKDMAIGTTGKSCAIEDLIIGVARRPKGDTRKLYFQVHQQDRGWKGVTPEGSASGTDGMGLRLEAVRIWLA
ncbi:MAG: Ig domain-containing protein, partial [Bacteroidales bacterium]|nr:Ig domain-containing protein [Bacteroidales bacterium]